MVLRSLYIPIMRIIKYKITRKPAYARRLLRKLRHRFLRSITGMLLVRAFQTIIRNYMQARLKREHFCKVGCKAGLRL